MRLSAPRTAGIGVLALLASVATSAGERAPAPPPPQEFVIGRHTFFDFGPPFDFYEVLSVRSTEGGSVIERFTLTPAGDACTQPATIEYATASVREPVFDLLRQKNPCAIPEKALRRELKRCKGCLVFSGADIVMQVQCARGTRRIRMDVLDRDLFDRAPRTPEHTSWTLEVLSRLDGVTDPGVMERSAFLPHVAKSRVIPESPALDELRRGAFDPLFEKAPARPSAIYAAARLVPPQPTVELVTSAPFRPVSPAIPEYPSIARIAHLEGRATFRVSVAADGSASDFRLLTSPPLLGQGVEKAVARWAFPPEAAGQSFEGAIEFKLNCPVPKR